MKNNIATKDLLEGDDGRIGLCPALSVVGSPYVQLGCEALRFRYGLEGGRLC